MKTISQMLREAECLPRLIQAVIQPCRKEDHDPNQSANQQLWCLYTKHRPKRLLGRHPSKESAMKQEQAIHSRQGGQTMKISTFMKFAEIHNAIDMLPSLFSLAKNNKGFWKSEAQGKYLLSMADKIFRSTKNDPNNKTARSYANKFQIDPDKSIALGITKFLDFLPGRHSEKARYIGYIFILDDNGVVMSAKIKIKHPSMAEDLTGMTEKEIEENLEKHKDDFKFIPGTESVMFKRDPNHTPPIDAHFFISERQKFNERQEKVKESQSLIDKIKAIPDYDDIYASGFTILQSFVLQLEAGKKLSPKQMQIVNKYLMEKEEIGVDLKNLLTHIKEFEDVIDKKVIDALEKINNEAAKENDFYKSLVGKFQEHWNAFKKQASDSNNPVADIIRSAINYITEDRYVGLGSNQQDFPEDMKKIVEKASKLTSSTKLTKKALNKIKLLEYLIKDIGGASQDRVNKSVEKALQIY